eukprot:365535-Chlamydomonas_euryale.AAC.37
MVRNALAVKADGADLRNAEETRACAWLAGACTTWRVPTCTPPYLDAHGLEVLLGLELAYTARRSQQCLGWHTTPVHACATNVMALDHGNLHALRSQAAPDQRHETGHRTGRDVSNDSRNEQLAGIEGAAPPPRGAEQGARLRFGQTLQAIEHADRIGSCAVAAHAAADDDQVVVILAGRRGRHDGRRRGAADALDGPPAQQQTGNMGASTDVIASSPLSCMHPPHKWPSTTAAAACIRAWSESRAITNVLHRKSSASAFAAVWATVHPLEGQRLHRPARRHPRPTRAAFSQPRLPHGLSHLVPEGPKRSAQGADGAPKHGAALLALRAAAAAPPRRTTCGTRNGVGSPPHAFDTWLIRDVCIADECWHRKWRGRRRGGRRVSTHARDEEGGSQRTEPACEFTPHP